MSHEPATPNEGKLPPKLFIEQRSLEATTSGKVGVVAWYDIEDAEHDGIFYAYISELTYEALLREARAKVYDEIADYYTDQIQMCCDTEQDPGGPTQIVHEILEMKAKAAREER